MIYRNKYQWLLMLWGALCMWLAACSDEPVNPEPPEPTENGLL